MKSSKVSSESSKELCPCPCPSTPCRLPVSKSASSDMQQAIHDMATMHGLSV